MVAENYSTILTISAKIVYSVLSIFCLRAAGQQAKLHKINFITDEGPSSPVALASGTEGILRVVRQ